MTEIDYKQKLEQYYRENLPETASLLLPAVKRMTQQQAKSRYEELTKSS